jgi:O-antigen ligase/tetratricopeptide (TPR) repeat protein
MARRTSLSQPAPLPRAREDESARSDREQAAWLGERVRRLALGLTVALITARAYWPAEPNFKEEAGTGLVWAFALLLAVGLALLGALLGGTLRVRRSWADAAVIGLMVLVALSAGRGLDRRPAINLAWEWGAVGFGYLLLRSLPRTRAESSALALVLVATAAAVAIYGLFQASVELPALRREYLRNPVKVLLQMGVEPGSPGQILSEKRLMESNEPWSTFALTNSLAGFLVGPLTLLLGVGWESFRRREQEGPGQGSRLGAQALAAGPALLMLICLILTKSRSAWVGLAVALAVIAWQSRRLVRTRTLVLAALGGLAVVSALVAAGLKTGRLDPLVLTESTKSLRYRWEYWVGTWALITEDARTFWGGVGPGNFGWAYLRHKLPQASEEIRDPHNMILDVWVTAGFGAALALVAALGLGLYNVLGAASRHAPPPPERPASPDLDGPPSGIGWLIGAGAAGLILVLRVGQFNLFAGDMFLRWLILIGSWFVVTLLILPLWRRTPIPAWALGAGALAVAVNLLAAGGIGISSVALGLWALLALGLNLRDDRPCSRLREYRTRLGSFALALVWAALVGIFAGAVYFTFWTLEDDLAAADDALRARPPQYERAATAYDHALRADKYSPRPWLGLAYANLRAWTDRGMKPGDRRWRTIPILWVKAVSAPRNPNSWVYHSERAIEMRKLLDVVGPHLAPKELLSYRANIVEATRAASRLYPTNASLHARLAEASAEIGMFGDAVKEAREALRLDGLTPHIDKKLAGPLRKSLQERLSEWESAAQSAPADVK